LFVGVLCVGVPIFRLDPPFSLFIEESIRCFGKTFNLYVGEFVFFSSEKINDLVFENCEQPCFFGGLAFEPVLGVHGCEQGFLNQIFSSAGIIDPLKGKSKKHITISIHPAFRVQQEVVRHVGIPSTVERNF